MNLALRTVLLIAALLVPLASMPANAQPVPTDGSAEWQGNSVALVLGGVAGVLLTIPGAWGGYELGNRLIPPSSSCDPAGCDGGYPIGGLLGSLAGGFLGASVGAGLGLSISGMHQGGRFHWWPAVGGAALGTVVGLLAGSAIGLGLFGGGGLQYGAIGLSMAGAVAGAYLGYSISNPWSPPPVAPIVVLVPGGGGMVGIIGSL